MTDSSVCSRDKSTDIFGFSSRAECVPDNIFLVDMGKTFLSFELVYKAVVRIMSLQRSKLKGSLFLWSQYEFGMTSCFHDRTVFVAIKIAFG